MVQLSYCHICEQSYEVHQMQQFDDELTKSSGICKDCHQDEINLKHQMDNEPFDQRAADQEQMADLTSDGDGY